MALRVSSGQSLTRAHVARDTLSVLEPSQIEDLVDVLDAQMVAHAAARKVLDLLSSEQHKMLDVAVKRKRLSFPAF